MRKKLKDENLSHLPPALELRKEVETAREQIAGARSEREARQMVANINECIRAVNRSALRGPATTVTPLDEELSVREWRERPPRAHR